jgi:hypothetical protein
MHFAPLMRGSRSKMEFRLNLGANQQELRDVFAVNMPSMSRDFFDPSPEQQNVVLIDAATLRKAEKLIESCEHCNPDGAEIPFDNVLDRIIGSDPSESTATRDLHVFVRCCLRWRIRDTASASDRFRHSVILQTSVPSRNPPELACLTLKYDHS